MQKVLIIAGSLLAFAGCKPHSKVSTTAYILGPQNDIVTYDESKKEFEDYKDVRKSAVLIATSMSNSRKKFCSGTLVEAESGSKGLRVLTNHHCFAEVDENGSVAKNWIAEACTRTVAYLGFVAGQEHDATSLPCLEGSLRTDFEGDLAVFTLDGKVPEEHKPLPIWSESTIPAGRDALIIHYPDIKANFVSLKDQSGSLPVASITETNCQTNGGFTEQEWRLDHTLPYSMRHSCDLVHGSSGSALIDKETKTILGVNWGGIKINFQEKTETTNVATRADYVTAFLSDATSELKLSVREKKQADAQRASTESRADASTGGSLGISCGVVGGSGVGGFWLILLALLAPLQSLIRPKR